MSSFSQPGESLTSGAIVNSHYDRVGFSEQESISAGLRKSIFVTTVCRGAAEMSSSIEKKDEFYPELIFAIAAPIGIDTNMVSDTLRSELTRTKYTMQQIKITDIMYEIDGEPKPTYSGDFLSYKTRIDHANKLRKISHDNGILSSLAISAIRKSREQFWIEKEKVLPKPGWSQRNGKKTPNDFEEIPSVRHAFLIRQLKRPEEVERLRAVYGKNLILISCFAQREDRIRMLSQRESILHPTKTPTEIDLEARQIVDLDSKQDAEEFGQNVRDAFALADFFVDCSNKPVCQKGITRLIDALFGKNDISPTKDEYGMYLAKSASLRSNDLSRQVGAALLDDSGQVLTLGCNEVPKFGGGSYWTNDDSDGRDFVQGLDKNEFKRKHLLIDIFKKLKEAKIIGDINVPETMEKLDEFLQTDELKPVLDSKLMDLIEFGRMMHAEMAALMDAARKGISVKHATLYCTTFPCHICTKHIVGAGISRVVFIEPYPKSYAFDLHSDAITENPKETEKVVFSDFIGISPLRYRDLFQKGRRKDRTGRYREWYHGDPKPMLEQLQPRYFPAESAYVDDLNAKLKARSSV